jgi:hypothetical protein
MELLILFKLRVLVVELEVQEDMVEVVEVEEHITGLIIFLLVRVKALVTQLELEVEVDLDGTIQIYLAELDREAALHGFIVLVLFMHLVVMLDHQIMIFTQEQGEAEDLTEVMLAVMEPVELAHIATVVEGAVVLVELGATAAAAAHRAVTIIRELEAAVVAEELMEAVMPEVYMMEVLAEIIGWGMAAAAAALEVAAEMDLLAVAVAVAEIAEPL